MKKGEKFLSFVKFEKEIESAYREKLSATKRPEETADVFIEFAINFLSKIKPEITRNHIDQIYFDPDSENGYKLSPNLEKILGNEILNSSDLPAILKRLALSAVHRRKALVSNNERTNMFRMQEKPDQH